MLSIPFDFIYGYKAFVFYKKKFLVTIAYKISIQLIEKWEPNQMAITYTLIDCHH